MGRRAFPLEHRERLRQESPGPLGARRPRRVAGSSLASSCPVFQVCVHVDTHTHPNVCINAQMHT